MIAGNGIRGAGETIHAFLFEFLTEILGQLSIGRIVDGKVAQNKHRIQQVLVVFPKDIRKDGFDLLPLGLTESVAGRR